MSHLRNADQPTIAALGDDLLRGVPQIAAFINESERKTYYLCERSYIPCGKQGSLWVASKKKLLRH